MQQQTPTPPQQQAAEIKPAVSQPGTQQTTPISKQTTATLERQQEEEGYHEHHEHEHEHGESEEGRGVSHLPDVPPSQMEGLRHFIAPLSKEQLIEIVAKASYQHDDVHDEVERVVAASPASRRLMVRNIAFSTSNEALNQLFRQFGEIEDSTIVRERDGRSKGFGFVTFRGMDSVQRALATPLSLDGRQLLVKLAADPYAEAGGQEVTRRKLFIRNLSDATTSESLRNEFASFGPMEECVVVCDAMGRSKGYGFVTFVRGDDAIRAVQQPQRIIDNRMAFVAFAAPTPPKTAVSTPTQQPASAVAALGRQQYEAAAYMPPAALQQYPLVGGYPAYPQAGGLTPQQHAAQQMQAAVAAAAQQYRPAALAYQLPPQQGGRGRGMGQGGQAGGTTYYPTPAGYPQYAAAVMQQPPYGSPYMTQQPPPVQQAQAASAQQGQAQQAGASGAGTPGQGGQPQYAQQTRQYGQYQ